MPSDDYSNAPISIGEARANKAVDATKWTPRDALISLLREIDSGKIKISSLVVAYSEDLPDGDKVTRVCVSTKGLVEALGLLARGQQICGR